MNIEGNIDRRTFMKLGGMISAAALLPDTLLASDDTKIFEKSLSFYNLHTGETLRSTYWAEGNYISGSLDEINHILRDHRTNTVMPMNIELLDLLFDIRNKLDSKSPYQIISGYRSPKTNNALRKNSSGVAKKSLHMEGKAIDINLNGVDLSMLRKVAMHQKKGGVGFYPASNFIHVDVGRVRYW